MISLKIQRAIRIEFLIFLFQRHFNETLQVSIEDRQTLNDLLPLLDALSKQHPDESVREMATDLRIAIATHGHVLSDALRDAAQQKLKPKRQKKNGEEIKVEVNAQESKKLKTEEKKKPLIEVLSSHDEDHKTAENPTPLHDAKSEQTFVSDSNVQHVKKTEDREKTSNNSATPSEKKSELDVAFEELMNPLSKFQCTNMRENCEKGRDKVSRLRF